MYERQYEEGGRGFSDKWTREGNTYASLLVNHLQRGGPSAARDTGGVYGHSSRMTSK